MKKILLVLLVFVGAIVAQAEVSPLPEIQFNFIYNTPVHPLISPQNSELMLCKDSLCTQPTALGVYGSQRMQCGGGACTAIAYEFEPFAQLLVGFEDGITRTSNIFPVDNTLIHKFNVYVETDKLVIEPVAASTLEPLWKRPQAWNALLLILVLELLAAAAFIFYTKKRFTILYGVAIANLITAMVTWGFLVHYVAQSALWWLFGVVLEALLIRLINRKDITLKDAGILSVLTNVTSYTLGMIISFIAAQM
ncbi:MAG: hypothetical protein IKW71_01310 [Elusimicrobiaceae bacterium]|nr:hypothetical protein [Elusimicrobiaceae bacterium]